MPKPQQQKISTDQLARDEGPLPRLRNWVLSIGLLIILGALAYLIGGNLAPAGFAGALLTLIIAVIQHFRHKRGRAPVERHNEGEV